MSLEIMKKYCLESKIGKIYKYDGITGTIVTDVKNYNFSYMGLDENVKIGDMVKFFINEDEMATDIRKYEKDIIRAKNINES